jgi:hypothetical protein
VDYTPETNAIMLLNMGHILRGECAWEGIGKEKET